MENEVQAVQKRRSTLSAEIEVETIRLVTERKRELAVLEADASSRLLAINDRIEAATGEVAVVERRKTSLEGEVVGIEADLVSLTNLRDGVQKQTRELTVEMEAKERRQLQIDARIQFLEGGIVPLEARQGELKTVLVNLERTRDELEGANATLDSRYLSRKDEVEREIKGLLAKQQELEVAQAQMIRQHEVMGEDIATRTKVLDEREEILKRREFKASGDERRIARNAGLLNL